MTDTTTDDLRDLAERIADGTATEIDFHAVMTSTDAHVSYGAYTGLLDCVTLIEQPRHRHDLTREVHHDGERVSVHWHSRADPGIASAQGTDEARTRLLAAIRAMIWLEDQG